MDGYCRCWWCRELLCWDSDFNYDEVHGEGEGIVTFLHCTGCGAEVMYSLRDDDPDDGPAGTDMVGEPR